MYIMYILFYDFQNNWLYESNKEDILSESKTTSKSTKDRRIEFSGCVHTSMYRDALKKYFNKIVSNSLNW